MVRTPSYRLHKPSGKAVVTLAGKDHYLGEYGSSESKKLYRRLLAEYLASDGRCPNESMDQEEFSVSQLLAAFLKFAKKHFGTKTRTDYEHYKRIARILRDLYGSTPAIKFGPQQFKAVRMSLVKKGAARKYVNATMSRIIRIFRWGSGEGLIPSSIAHTLKDVETLKKGRSDAPERDKIPPVPDEIVEATIPHLPPVVADMVRFQRLTGCRPGEVCMIAPAMIDRSKDVWEIHLSKHKTAWRDLNRVIFVGPKAQAILLPYLLRDENNPCFAPSESERKRRMKAHDDRQTPLSCGNTPGSRRKQRRLGQIPKKRGIPPGRAYSTATYGRAVQRACDKAFPPPGSLNDKEIENWISAHRWAPNQLRHSFGTKVRSQFGLEESQVLLGHSSADVTEIYALADAEKARAAARMIG